MTSYLKNDKMHVSASIPAVRLEGTEASAANLELRENAGNIELYDVTNAVVRAQWSGTTGKRLTPLIVAAEIAADAIITAKILDANVTYAKIQNVSATDKLLGRSAAGAGVTEEITCTAAGRALLDDVDAVAQLITLGLTASAAELNILDGALLTVAELNYVGGVTSAIQTQLGTKAPLAGPTFTGLVKKSTTAAITAFATGGQASAVELVSDINEVSVCATAADSVKLPGGIAGMEIMVVNHGAAAMNLFPASGDYINEAAVDTAVSIGIDGTALCYCYIADYWEIIEAVRA